MLKKNLPIRNLSLSVKFQATYTTKHEFCTFYDVKEKEIKCYNALQKLQPFF